MDPQRERLSEQEVREVLEHLAREKNSPSVADVAAAANVSEADVARALQKVRAERVEPVAPTHTETQRAAPDPSYYEEYREVSYRRGGGAFAGMNGVTQIVSLIVFCIVAFTIASGACSMQREMQKDPWDRLQEMQQRHPSPFGTMPDRTPRFE
jgi:hypothetical protein